MSLMTAFKDLTVFITGCNRGIGLALVQYMLEYSPKLIFATCRSVKSERSLKLNELAEKHANVRVLELDVNNAQQIATVVEEVGKEVGSNGLNLLINNAGIYDLEDSVYGTKTSTLDEVTPEIMLKVFETNTVAPLMICKSFLPLLKQAASHKSSTCQPQAAIVNVSSCDGSITMNAGGFYQYKSSKAALNMVTKSLSIDLAKYGITVVCVDPGYIKTDMGGEIAPQTIPEAIPALLKTIGLLNKKLSGSFLSHTGSTLPW